MTDRLRVVYAADPEGFPAEEFDGRIDLEIARTDEEERTLLRNADVLYGWNVPDVVPAQTPDLRWVQIPSAGADHLRGRPVWNSDIIITSSKGIHVVPMAEHFFAMLLGLVRQIPAITRAQQRHEWVHDTKSVKFGEVRGRTLGIIGWGKIGDGIAHTAGALGLRVIGTRFTLDTPHEIRDLPAEYSDPPWLSKRQLQPNEVYPADRLHDVLAQSDVVVVILPLTRDTQGLIGRTELAALRRGALFFNLGRGAVVDESALVEALRSGRLGGAGLDVFEREPLPASSPLWDMTNVIVSPHVGGMSDRTRIRAAHFFAENLRRYLEGESLLNVVNRSNEY